ncbi:cupin domain-containing protein [Paenibacillus whitsoniae]|uniref:Cupin domain-containing protein n=1 Tax=Paenibacillus whitsoniae TaxID=2496558 RepID=A0A430JI52_9BACL|nr:cupin domain-containing protein [Paenibacillus whitsoniae]RTE10721.1 cupin domain-containing protein [Paenibacillus whitsoniae]
MEHHNRNNRTIENPIIGDRVTFLSTSMETDGDHELVEVELNPGGKNDLHYHISYCEEFEALEGSVYVDCSGGTYIVQPGEKKTIQIGSVHRFYNPGPTPIKFRVKISPARSFEPMLRIAYGLIQDGKTNSKGIPRNIFELAIIFQLGESYLPGLPRYIQKGLFGCLYLIATGLGIKKRLYQTYCMDTISPS